MQQNDDAEAQAPADHPAIDRVVAVEDDIEAAKEPAEQPVDRANDEPAEPRRRRARPARNSARPSRIGRDHEFHAAGRP